MFSRRGSIQTLKRLTTVAGEKLAIRLCTKKLVHKAEFVRAFAGITFIMIVHYNKRQLIIPFDVGLINMSGPMYENED